MGLLDDAIRDHLDLKRRRGADPAEVERAEREALGPVRRGVEPPGEAGHEAEAPPEDPADSAPEDAVTEPGYDPADETVWSEPAPEALAPLEPGEPTFESADTASERPDAPPAAPPPTVAEPSTGPAPADSGPEPAAAPRPITQPDEDGGETVEYDVERALEHDPSKESDDVLEETPEFLQDTPDHDRLWFEQRPPRDFDFDG
jgi:hypothetical protein